jgi:hypothetical protein
MLRKCRGVCRTVLLLLTVAALTMANRQVGAAQDSIFVPLKITDSKRGSLTLTIGVHTAATKGFDFQLNERPIPPPPAAPVLDARLVDPFRQKGEFAGLDAYVDIHPYTSPDQIDTFFVKYRPAPEGFPVTIQWPDTLGQLFHEALLLYKEDSAFKEWNMVKDSGVVLHDQAHDLVLIITHGPRLPEKIR